MSPSGGQVSSLESERQRGDGFDVSTGKETDAILISGAGFGKGRAPADPRRTYPAGVMSRVCGPRGVTSGPRSPQYMFTSLRTPNSPAR